MASASDLRRAAATRDVALARLRRLTAVVVAVGLALTAVFAALASGSTHVTKAVVRHVRARSAPSPPVAAPVPPLVAAHDAAPTPAPSAAPAPTPAPAPQAASPVVVSGGS